jgi:hypothetical protein
MSLKSLGHSRLQTGRNDTTTRTSHRHQDVAVAQISAMYSIYHQVKI